MRISITILATALIFASFFNVSTAQVVEGFYSKVELEEFIEYGETKYKIIIDLDINRPSRVVGAPRFAFPPAPFMRITNGDTLWRVYRPISFLSDELRANPHNRTYHYSRQDGAPVNVTVGSPFPRNRDIKINVDKHRNLTIQLNSVPYDGLSRHIEKYMKTRKTDLLSIVLDGNVKMEEVQKVLNQIEKVRNSLTGIEGPVLKPAINLGNAITFHIQPDQVLINNEVVNDQETVSELKKQVNTLGTRKVVLLARPSLSLSRYYEVRKRLEDLKDLEFIHLTQMK